MAPKDIQQFGRRGRARKENADSGDHEAEAKPGSVVTWKPSEDRLSGKREWSAVPDA